MARGKQEAVTTRELRASAIREHRVAAGLSQGALAEAMAAKGFDWKTRGAISEVESGKRPVTDEHLYALSEIFDVHPLRFIAAPGGRVVVGSKTVSADDWNDRWSANLQLATYETGFWSEEAREDRRARIEGLRDRDRRRLLQEREARLQEHKRQPGTTFVADRDVDIVVPVPTLGIEHHIQLKTNEPHVARDRWEAQALLEAMRQETVRIIDRFEARRLRDEAHMQRKAAIASRILDEAMKAKEERT